MAQTIVQRHTARCAYQGRDPLAGWTRCHALCLWSRHQKRGFFWKKKETQEQSPLHSEQPPEQGKAIVDGYSPTHFSVNGELIEGPIFLLPTRAFVWKVSFSFDEIAIDSLVLAHTIRPRIKLLLLGSGPHFKVPSPELREFFRSKGIAIEAMSSRHAASTWNILNQENRAVAAALLPCGDIPQAKK